MSLQDTLLEKISEKVSEKEKYDTIQHAIAGVMYTRSFLGDEITEKSLSESGLSISTIDQIDFSQAVKLIVATHRSFQEASNFLDSAEITTGFVTDAAVTVIKKLAHLGGFSDEYVSGVFMELGAPLLAEVGMGLPETQEQADTANKLAGLKLLFDEFDQNK